MTEAEWIAATDPYDMLMHFPAKWDHRKLWLFGCACLRRVWHLLKDQRSRCCVELAERFVDGQASEQEAGEVWDRFFAAADTETLEDFGGFDSYETIRNLVCFVDPGASLQIASEVAEGVGGFAAQAVPVTPPATWSDTRTKEYRRAQREERASQVKLLRDIFGNPFRSVSMDSSWLTPRVVELAHMIYDDRGFDRLPILADALEEAGCTDADILNHCRQPGEHVRGCWVVDLILGKS